ncbi:MAG: hypothetical protein ABJO88_12465, partial [Parasphingorhabdus sp.]
MVVGEEGITNDNVPFLSFDADCFPTRGVVRVEVGVFGHQAADIFQRTHVYSPCTVVSDIPPLQH